MKKLLHIVGTRPQYVKLFPLFKHVERQLNCDQLVYDTGQHFDENMSKLLLDEFELTDIRTGDLRGLVGAVQAARMLENIWQFVESERPDYAIVYGDTNSTAMAAVACARLQIPFGHVEAGVRTLPEVGVQEGVNRKIADHLASHLYCVTDVDAQNLAREGISDDRIFVVGDLMHDAFVRISNREVTSESIGSGSAHKPTVLVTLHRAENIDDPDRRARLLAALTQSVDRYDFVLPIHPRLRSLLGADGLRDLSATGIKVVDPLTYAGVVQILNGAHAVVTDSGGLPKDAAFAGVRSIVLRPDPIWVALWEMGYIETVQDVDAFDSDRLLAFLDASDRKPRYHQDLASPRIIEVLSSIVG